VPKPIAIATLGTIVCLAVVRAAPAPAADDQSGRFTMSPAEGGVVRLDRETGAMSFCSGKEGDWSCKPMPDAEQKLHSRIDNLERENKSLKEERRLAETSPPGAAPPQSGDTVPPAPPGDLAMPTERDVDKLFDYVEGMVKKFKERIQRLEKEAEKEQTPL
jgi:hypothetical protein